MAVCGILRLAEWPQFRAFASTDAPPSPSTSTAARLHRDPGSAATGCASRLPRQGPPGVTSPSWLGWIDQESGVNGLGDQLSIRVMSAVGIHPAEWFRHALTGGVIRSLLGRFAHQGHVRRRHLDDQIDQALCLTLVTNAAVLWTTTYLADALDALRAEGFRCGHRRGHGTPDPGAARPHQLLRQPTTSTSTPNSDAKATAHFAYRPDRITSSRKQPDSLHC